MHSDLNDQNLFHFTIDAAPGVPGVSKNPKHQSEVYPGELEPKVQLTKMLVTSVPTDLAN